MQRDAEVFRAVCEKLKGVEEFVAAKASAFAEDRAYSLSQALLSIAQDLARLRSRLDGTAGVQTSSAALAVQRVEYPQFFERHGELVKRGLKRDRKSTYEHSVPKSGYFSIVDVIAGLLADKSAFNSEEVIGRCKSTPRYQVHIVLAYLTKQGVLRTQGRGIYSASNSGGFREEAKRAWEKLPVEI